MTDNDEFDADDFVKIEIPRAWLGKASRLPGRSLIVALIIAECAIVCEDRVLTVPLDAFVGYGVPSHAVRRALIALDDAGLIRAARHTGRRPLVTVLFDGAEDNSLESATVA